MNIQSKKKILREELKKNDGLLRLAPNWVARNFLHPGRRLKLDPRDVYAYGGEKGGIDERWFASTTPTDIGSNAIENEGLSYIVVENNYKNELILLKEAIEIMGDEIIGKHQMNKYGGWMAYSKFFDNMGPIGHHVHLMDEHAKNVGRLGKPEGYYFPVQMNNVGNNFPHTYFGLNPGTTKEDVIKCLTQWSEKGDNGILDLSRAYRLELGTGWDVPPGVLHAPGSLLTYEPQRASDVALFFQSMVEGRNYTREFLVKDVPKDKNMDYEYLISVLDWEKNIDPDFKENRFLKPIFVKDEHEMNELGYIEKWIVYGCNDFCAKELTVLPGKSVTIKDSAAYGFIMIEGYGQINNIRIETPSMIRFGQLTSDEMFVTEDAAKEGVTITNMSSYDSIVMLKHFGPDNDDAKQLIKHN